MDHFYVQYANDDINYLVTIQHSFSYLFELKNEGREVKVRLEVPET